MNKSDKPHARGFFLAGGLLSVFLSACAGMGQWPENDTEAYRTFAGRCGSCHNLPHPARHTPEQWDGMLALMVDIMKERNVSYTQQEMKTIRDYLHRNAR